MLLLTVLGLGTVPSCCTPRRRVTTIPQQAGFCHAFAGWGKHSGGGGVVVVVVVGCPGTRCLLLGCQLSASAWHWGLQHGLWLQCSQEHWIYSQSSSRVQAAVQERTAWRAGVGEGKWVCGPWECAWLTIVGKRQKPSLYQSVAEIKVVPRAGESLHPLWKPAAIAASPSGSSFTVYCTGEVLHSPVGQIGISCQMSC